jgi:O-acetyl-ADP-ribose deacetylase (regulator of RNase III)
MKITVRDRNAELINALKQTLVEEFAFADDEIAPGYPISLEIGDVLKWPAEALVSPANSFGYMDGGVDRVYCEQIGWHLQTDLQAYIRDNTGYGEVYIGQAVIIPTGDERFPNLISAPTMRMPGVIPDHNVFLATRAAVGVALIAEVESVLMPGHHKNLKLKTDRIKHLKGV